MTGRVLGQYNFLALPTLNSEIIDAVDLPTRHDAIAAGRKVDLLADYRHSTAIFDQLGRKQSDHIERSPQDMALAAGEQVAGFDGVIHNRQPNIKSVLFEEHALVTWFQTGISHNNRRPPRPNVDRKFDDEFAVLRGFGVVTHAGHCRNARALDQRGGIGADQERQVSRSFFLLCQVLFDPRDINRLILWFALRRDFVPPAVNAETDHRKQEDG